MGTRRKVALARVGVVVAAVAIAGIAGGSAAGDATSPVGQPPPEWAANAGAWPAHNYDLANTRATTQTPINSQTVSKLKVKWRFAFKGASAFGVFASTPIVLNGTVYLQDLNSNVYALDRSTGKVKWEHMFNKPSVGPNGVALRLRPPLRRDRDERLRPRPPDREAGLDPQADPQQQRGHRHDAPALRRHGRCSAPIPGNTTSFYKGNGDGIVWALDAATGKTKWTFNTISDGAKLFGNPKVNSGGGLWYPPAVDSQGRVFISVANPAPLYGTPEVPRTARAAPAPTSTPTRSSRSTARPGSCSGSGRPSRTTCATTT